MREIKYRAFHYDTMSWINIIELEVNGLWVRDENEKFWLGFDSVVLEQYTGLKDVNGAEIHEGDIVQRAWLTKMPDGSINTTKIDKPFEVKVGNYVYGKWVAKEVLTTGFGVINYVVPDELLVVGNVHENLELLEGADVD